MQGTARLRRFDRPIRFNGMAKRIKHSRFPLIQGQSRQEFRIEDDVVRRKAHVRDGVFFPFVVNDCKVRRFAPCTGCRRDSQMRNGKRLIAI